MISLHWPRDIADLRLIDPCCGSGHFLVEAFKMLFQMRQELGESATAAAAGVLEDNIYGLELDSRCVQIAAFALALTAWKSGYPPEKPLPIPHIACSGLPLGADAREWQQLANGDSYLAEALLNLHSVFQQAPELGSLIDPRRNGFENLPLLEHKQDQLLSHLETALAKEKHQADPVAQVFGSFAKGTLRLLSILKEKYHLVVTNPPFLLRSYQSGALREFCDREFSGQERPSHLFYGAMSGVYHCLRLLCPGESAKLAVLTTDRHLRKKMLTKQTWRALARLGERDLKAMPPLEHCNFSYLAK